ncbi:hypothetical protein ACJMK2_044015 [Sinanodonta woodiana]|uniref:K Homology domain-containing protein n=1 Tax=Sinanodonta woodiana TaxID=1069815 RepID=A0ABD3VYM7_SINWO
MEDQGMKREREDDAYDDDDDNDQPKRRRDDGKRVELRILLQSKNAGAIIGKGGNNIKRLRTEYKASVTVPDSDGPERILTVCADLGTALDCLLDIIPTLEDYKNMKDKDFDCEIRLLVHQSQAGCIIGRAGFKIKELREKTGTQIKVYSQCCPNSTERIVAIQGKPEPVVNCIDTIFDLLETAPPKGPNVPYEPHNYDEYFAAEYGGFTRADGGRGGKAPRGLPPGREGGFGGGSQMGSGRMGSSRGGGGRSGGMGRMGGMGDMGMGADDMGFGGRSGMSAPRTRGGMSGSGGLMGGMRSGGGSGLGGGMGGDRNLGGGGMSRGMQGGGRGGMRSTMSSGGGGFGGRGGDSFGGGMDFMDDNMGGMGQQGMMFGNDPTSNTQVTIPKDLAGAIIGKGGSRISEIRRQSNAQIVIDEALPGSNDRIITITGTEEQIQNAQYLLQMSVKKYSGKY